MSNPYYYEGVNPTVDLIVINPEGKILLVKRSAIAAACAGMWAIPGGFVDTEAKRGEKWRDGLETLEIAAVRELKEETNLQLESPELTFIGEFEGNKRDPRDNDISWSKSHAFMYVIPKDIYEVQKHNIVGVDADGEIEDVKWMSIEEIRKLDLAFDHKQIIELAWSKYQNSLKNKMKM